ncbi:E3 ubiquitin-protein ligase RNF14-like [Pholidichthys leucotaenia]
MNADLEEQEDELTALHSIYGPEEFVRDESKFAGQIRVCVDLPADFSVTLKDGETLRQYQISFLPPVILTFDLPDDYPSSSPPIFTLTCSWLTQTQLSALTAQLCDLYQATGGTVMLFSWIQFLKEDALRFLSIQNLLEIPVDEHNTLHPESTDDQRCGVSDHYRLHISENPSASDGSSRDPWRGLGLDSTQAGQNTSTSQQSQSELKSPSSETIPKQTAHISDVTAPQSSEFSAEQFLDKNAASVSSLLPSDSSNQQDPSEHGASFLLVHSKDPPQDEDHTVPGLSLTPSQILLSQILIHDAAQKQKVFATTVFDCGVCFMSWLGSECVHLPECGHIFCRGCLSEFCKVQIAEGNVRGVTCPQGDCTAAPTPAQVKNLVGEELFSRYDRLLLQSTLDGMSDVTYCPRRSCGSPVIQEKSSTAALCSVCGFAFCVMCKKTYHGTEDCQTEKTVKKMIEEGLHGRVALPQSEEGLKALWDDYVGGSKERRHLLESRYGRRVLMDTLTDDLSENWMTTNTKFCPHCFKRIEKNGGCNFMKCTQCWKYFCWRCLTRLTFVNGGQHFQESSCSTYY